MPHLHRSLYRHEEAAEYLKSELGVVPAPYKPEEHDLLDWTGNIAACKRHVTIEQLKTYMRMRTRFDLEQAAALVISAFITAGSVDDAVRLFGETHRILKTSSMWIDPEEPLHHTRVESQGISNIALKLQVSAVNQGIKIPSATTISELVPLLMRVRRRKPNDRCLIIPQWMFEEAQITPPPHYQHVFKTSDHENSPLAPPDADSIPVSRHHFRTYQRKLFALYQFWKPEISLRARIKKMANDVLYGSSYLDSRVFDTDDVALLSCYFFSFQRRLQRKVVSTKDGDAFLERGEGGRLYQNNLSIKSTFEVVLQEMVDESSEGVIVVMGADDTLDMIDRTCRLMREYVDVHGAGKAGNLTFNKGQIGGRGRGPVDEYNVLCDVLEYLRRQARDEGIVDVPGPTWKFLAKDIMSVDGRWGDDAFANGRKAGWEEWMERREGLGGEEWEVVVK